MKRFRLWAIWFLIAAATLSLGQVRESDLREGDISSTSVPDWAQSTPYVENQLVLNGGEIYRRTESGASGLVFDPNDWIAVAGVPISSPGDLVIGGAAGEPYNLPLGNSGCVLQSDGTTMTWVDLGVYPSVAAVKADPPANLSRVLVSGYDQQGDAGVPWSLRYHDSGRSAVTLDGGFFIAGDGVDDYLESLDKTNISLKKFGIDEGDDITEAINNAMANSVQEVRINLDVTEVEAYGILIENKEYVEISTEAGCKIYIPDRGGSGPGGSYNVSTQEANHDDCPILINGCRNVKVSGPIEINGSRATFNKPTIENTATQFSLEVNCNVASSLDSVEVSGITIRDNGYGGVMVRTEGVGEDYGYNQVHIHHLNSFDSPLNIAWTRGKMKQILIEDIYAEDPNAKSIFHSSAASGTVQVSSQLTNNTRTYYSEMVAIKRVYSRYSHSNIKVQQGYHHHLMDDIRIDSRGYFGNGDPITTYAGGPSTKVDNVYWTGPSFAKISNYHTTNTNTGNGYLSLRVGQAGDQNIEYHHCDFDADVVMPGFNDPVRPGSIEGYSRFSKLSNCIFRGPVYVGRNHCTIEDCVFMGDTVADPTYPFSQHDTIDDSVALKFGMSIVGDNVYVRDCTFIGTYASVDSTSNVTIQRPTYIAGGELRSANGFAGHVEVIEPTNIHVVGSFSTAGTAGSFRLVEPIGSVTSSISGGGPGGPLTLMEKRAGKTLATTAELSDASHPVNNQGKTEGSTAFDTTTDKTLSASGPLPTDPWVDGDGVTAITPS